jgi:hypothetical protein
MNNEFKLSKLEILEDLNGKTYQDFPQEPLDFQTLFDTYPIRVIKILKESSTESSKEKSI